MDRDYSPDYTAPNSRSHQRSSRSPSRSHRRYQDNRGGSPPSERSYRARDDYRRSPPDYGRSSRRRSRSRSRSRRSRSRSPFQDRKPRVGQFPWDDQETLRSLYCRNCDVKLNDYESMMGHLKGTNHLMQLKRIKDNEVRQSTGHQKGLNDVLVPTGFDEEYWNREKGPRKLRPEQERMLDNSRFDHMPTKFDKATYDNGQYKFNEKELYCEVCDVWVRSRDQMQAHKDGANHKKKSAHIKRYECKLCLIQVPCQDTLNNHMRGKDHLKRERQLAEKRRERGEEDPNLESYKTGPLEMEKLNNDDHEELQRLRQENRILKSKVEDYKRKIEKCAREHGGQEELVKYKKWCLETHVRPQEMARPGLHVKKEEPTDGYDLNIPSTSSSQPHVKSEVNREEYLENDMNDEIVIE